MSCVRARRPGFPAGAAPLVLLAALGATPPLARGEPGPASRPGGAPDPAGDLVAAARASALASDPQWLRLVHYRRGLLGGWESQADGPGFFLAPDGKTDPQAELEATLGAFLAPAGEAPDVHAQCRFPARLAWLSRALGVPPARLARPACPALDAYRARLAARSVTLVFSSHHVQSAASAFGHTFLRLNRSVERGDGTGRELLDTGVNYAAVPDTADPLLSAWKGLTGGFRGEFAYLPYYYKVREYGDFESRDLWEYDLDLGPEETARLVDHVWELGHTWFDYFYADENCSYHVLAALDAARPGLDLAGRTKPLVVPADTVRLVHDTPGLVTAVRYRPSIRTQFRARAAGLAPAESEALAALSSAPDAALPGLGPASQARVLDAAVDWIDWVHARDIVGNLPTPAADAKQLLLVRRASLGIRSETLEVEPPEDEAPHRGHGSALVGIGAGPSYGGPAVIAVDLRLAGHGLADPPTGYPQLDEFLLGSARLQWEPATGAVRLTELTAVGVRSLADFGRFDRRLSWQLSAGATTLRDGGCSGCLAGQGEAGLGLATSLGPGSFLTVFALADAAVQGTPRLSGIGGGPVRIGLGPAAGARAVLPGRLVVLATGSWWWLPGASPGDVWTWTVEARLGLGKAALGASFRADPQERLGLATAYLYF